MKFAVVAALMAAVSGADTCAKVKFLLFTEKGCPDAKKETLDNTNAFNNVLANKAPDASFLNTALKDCIEKDFNGKKYYYKATCPNKPDIKDRKMTFQLYNPNSANAAAPLNQQC